MKINVEIDEKNKEVEIIIRTCEMNDTVNNIIQKLSDETPKLLVGFIDNKVKILDELEVIRVYTGVKKVFAVTNKEEYLMRIPLYEVMGRLSPNEFVRISNTEIINLKKVVEFDLSFSGTICVKLSNGDVSYVSRRFVSRIKQKLGIGGK